MNDLDTLRPEVRTLSNDLLACADEVAEFPHPSHCDHLHDAAALMRDASAGLLRLTDENARLLAANRDAMDHFEQMKAELTIAHRERDRMFLDAREWATRFGEMEARAERAEAELAAMKARIAEAPVGVPGYDAHPWMTIDDDVMPPEWEGKRVRLVVEE